MQIRETIPIKGSYDKGKYFIQEGKKKKYLEYRLTDQNGKPINLKDEKIFFEYAKDNWSNSNKKTVILGEYLIGNWYLTKKNIYKQLLPEDFRICSWGRYIEIKHSFTICDLQDKKGINEITARKHNTEIEKLQTRQELAAQAQETYKQILELQQKLTKINAQLAENLPLPPSHS